MEQNPPTSLIRDGQGPTWAEHDAVVARYEVMIAERDARFAAMDAQLTKLTGQLTAVLGRVSELEAQVKQNSGNSSKPPSSDLPYKKPFRANKPTGKKPGGQDGHEGKTHTPFAAEGVTAKPVVPAGCGHCGGEFVVDAPSTGAPFVFQHIELPAMPPLVIEYQLHERCCASCGGVTRGQLPGDVGPSPYGPRLQALVVTWAIQFHLSRRQIQRLLASLYGLTMCTGTIQGIIERVASACEPAVADLKAAIGRAPVANADETGHMHQGGGAKGKRHWLWVAVTIWGAVFAAAAERGQAGLELVLGKDFTGIVGCDRWRPYETCYGENRQLCWAHLKREGQAAVDQAAIMLKSKDAAIRFNGERLLAWGQAFLALYKAMFESWQQFQAGVYDRVALIGAMAAHQSAFDDLFRLGLTVERKKVKAMCKDLLRPVQRAALWQFVTVPGVEPTNNSAERALRQPVLLRRKSAGTRSTTGMNALATLLSVVETCRRQGRSVLDYLEAVIRAHRLEQRPPSLVPA